MMWLLVLNQSLIRKINQMIIDTVFVGQYKTQYNFVITKDVGLVDVINDTCMKCIEDFTKLQTINYIDQLTAHCITICLSHDKVSFLSIEYSGLDSSCAMQPFRFTLAVPVLYYNMSVHQLDASLVQTVMQNISGSNELKVATLLPLPFFQQSDSSSAKTVSYFFK